ncbi:MAG: histidine triad nucleotide-binding protein [Myxococcaceae bacterium]|nr:MAG: histidine triad nucleotide-binding protein [Myxococcaceae bacterium]
MSDPDCLFCNIVAGEIPADIVREDEHTVAFRDIAPQAPTHVLVIPRDHRPNAVASAEDPAIGSRLLQAAGAVADAEGLSDYRLVFNTGAEAGQTVFHTHLHVLGGRSFQWPPG